LMEKVIEFDGSRVDAGICSCLSRPSLGLLKNPHRSKLSARPKIVYIYIYI
jgi:hypothetical protein